MRTKKRQATQEHTRARSRELGFPGATFLPFINVVIFRLTRFSRYVKELSPAQFHARGAGKYLVQ